MGIRISLAILLVVSFLAACASPKPTATPTPRPTATPAPTETRPAPTNTAPHPTNTREPTKPPPTATQRPTDIPKPTETLVSSGYEKVTDGTYVYHTETGQKINIAKITGLRQELKDANGVKAIIYTAERDNPYGLKESDYGGEFCPGVFSCHPEKQIGGLTLNSKVALKILKDQLAKIPNQRDRWLIPLPADIRGLQKVVLRYESGFGDYQVPVIKILFSGEAPVSNVMPNVTTLRVMKNIYYGWVFIGDFRGVEPYTDNIYPGREMDYISVGGQMTDFVSNFTVEASFGKKVSLVKSFAIVKLGGVKEYFTPTPEKTLSVGGLPVFVAANE